MVKRMGVLVSLLLIAVLVAACGGGGGSAKEEASTAPSGGSAQKVTVVAKEFSFTPSDLTVKKGEPVEIVLKNEGSVKHDLHITELGVKSELVSPGSSTTISFTPEKSGEFKLFCAEPGHEASGMVGTIKVEG